MVVHASTQMNMHDMIFHVIFGSDIPCTMQFVRASAHRLYSITQCPFLAGMMQSIDRGEECRSFARGRGIGDDVIRALFFLLLNVDDVLKRYVCMPGSIKAFAEAMNICIKGNGTNAHDDQNIAMLRRMHAWSMMGTKPLDVAKGKRFFVVLHDSIVKLWMQDERLHASDLVQMVKEEYLVS